MDNLIYFLYWTFTEGTYGQSIGKMVMKIEMKKTSDKPMELVSAMISSLGKVFLLPLDCFIGWIFYPNRKQRLFNYLSETVVIKSLHS
jgi:uncharacterized RDD family membrane protein YckC